MVGGFFTPARFFLSHHPNPNQNAQDAMARIYRCGISGLIATIHLPKRVIGMWHADGKDMPACVPPDAGVVFTGANILVRWIPGHLASVSRPRRQLKDLIVHKSLNRIEPINCRRVMHFSPEPAC